MSAKAGSRPDCQSASSPQKCDNLLTELAFDLAEMLFAREEDCEQLSGKLRNDVGDPPCKDLAHQ